MIRLWWSAARPPAQPPAPAVPLPLLCRLFGHSWQHWPDPTCRDCGTDPGSTTT